MIVKEKSRNFWQSIILVSGSAICAAEWTQCNLTPCFILSLITKASRRVLCSWHWGMVFLVMTSYRDLQSTTATLSGISRREISGCFQSMDGHFIQCHRRRNHSPESTACESAYVSAVNVLATTLFIFFECHDTGLAKASFCSVTSLCAMRIMQPFWDCCFSRVANDASEYVTKRMSFSGIGDITISTLEYFLASASNLLHSWRSFIVAHVIRDCRKL